MPERLVRIEGPYDFRGTLASLSKSGMMPPVARWIDGTLYKATSTPAGSATVALTRHPEGVHAEAWGDGADWVLERVHHWVGAHDDPGSFRPDHPLLAELVRRHPGIRLAHTGRVFDSLLFVIIGQKVTTKGAMGSRKQLYFTYGEPAPGPADLRLPPSPTTLKTVAYYDLHPMNIERKRAEILLHAARVAKRLEECVDMPIEDARQRLMAVRGIGPWTVGLVGGAALGDPDAVAVGDYHLKNAVAWLLAGEPRATDERMMELLEPYAGHKRRVIHLLGKTGEKAPRYGPRLAVNDIRGR
ncbi:MAG: DNA-3-methyladenine glycosylase 2 [Alphaproteobacteria bacterium]|nr:DNA-3-methyladenine glycosylase 2 [Alphaproteobacteria bacterium]